MIGSEVSWKSRRAELAIGLLEDFPHGSRRLCRIFVEQLHSQISSLIHHVEDPFHLARVALVECLLGNVGRGWIDAGFCVSC